MLVLRAQTGSLFCVLLQTKTEQTSVQVACCRIGCSDMINFPRLRRKCLIRVKKEDKWVMGTLIKQSAVSWSRGSFVTCRDKNCDLRGYRHQKSDAKKARQVDFGPSLQPSTYLCPFCYQAAAPAAAKRARVDASGSTSAPVRCSRFQFSPQC